MKKLFLTSSFSDVADIFQEKFYFFLHCFLESKKKQVRAKILSDLSLRGMSILQVLVLLQNHQSLFADLGVLYRYHSQIRAWLKSPVELGQFLQLVLGDWSHERDKSEQDRCWQWQRRD